VDIGAEGAPANPKMRGPRARAQVRRNMRGLRCCTFVQ